MPDPERSTSTCAGAWFARATLGLWLVGLLLRLAAIRHTTVISRDGIAYLAFARRVLEGDVDALVRAHYPPGFPALLAALAGPFGLTETTGAVAAAFGSALVIPAVALLAARAHGRVAGACAGLLAAALPELVIIGGEVLSDGWYLTLLAWLLVLLQRLHERGGLLAGVGAGVVAGAAYLTRPEALVVLGGGALGLLVLPRAGARRGAGRRWCAGARRERAARDEPGVAREVTDRPRAAGERLAQDAPHRRVADLGWLLLPGLLVIVPYLLAIRAHPVLGGVEGAGQFKLTLKQNLPQLLAAASPGKVLGNAARLLGRVAVVLAPALPLLALAAWARAPRVGPRGATRRFFGQLALIGPLLLLSFAIVRPDPRFGDQLALLLVPAAGLGLARALRAWRRHRGPAWLPMLALVLVCAPIALRDRHERKLTYRDVGALLAGERARRVLSEDSRAAFYAGAEAVWLPPDARGDAAAIVSLAASAGADAVVLVARTPEQEATSRAVGDLLGGQSPWRVERRDAETLHVFWTR